MNVPIALRTLRWFTVPEFRHPDLVDPWSAEQLDAVRDDYSHSHGPTEGLTLTDDARLPSEIPPGSAGAASLHLKGQAFDIRTHDKTREQLFRLVAAVTNRARLLRASHPSMAGIELELVASPADHHCHIGFFKDGRADRLELALT